MYSRTFDVGTRLPAPVRDRRCANAFTLIELVVAISVSVIISGVAGSLIWEASRQRSEIAARSELVDVGAAALETLFRYVREIPQDECPANPSPCLFGHAQISTASATELTFDSTGFRLDAGNNRLEMTLDGGTSWHPLANDVSGLTLSYYDRGGASLASFPLSQPARESVRRIGVEVQLTRSNQNAKLRSSVYLRSFMDEVSSAYP